MLLTRSPLVYPRRGLTARLACVRHAASVRPEPGSNSPTKTWQQTNPTGAKHPQGTKLAQHQQTPSTLLSSQKTPAPITHTQDPGRTPSRVTPILRQGNSRMLRGPPRGVNPARPTHRGRHLTVLTSRGLPLSCGLRHRAGGFRPGRLVPPTAATDLKLHHPPPAASNRGVIHLFSPVRCQIDGHFRGVGPSEAAFSARVTSIIIGRGRRRGSASPAARPATDRGAGRSAPVTTSRR